MLDLTFANVSKIFQSRTKYNTEKRSFTNKGRVKKRYIYDTCLTVKRPFFTPPIVRLVFLNETVEFVQSLGAFILVDDRSIRLLASLYQQIDTTMKLSTKVRKIRKRLDLIFD